MRNFFCFLIRLYQRYISPLTYPSCRYVPSCSSYTLAAVKKFGAFWGIIMGGRRILTCFSHRQWIYDPLPDRRPGWKDLFSRKGA
ncbi:MAG TPA: membrane protein insertion efficiency factor YidD [Firmicutes bacterium]|nr:membrane protein insertion efficiency factor YidD [Bacillota bacterium]